MFSGNLQADRGMIVLFYFKLLIYWHLRHTAYDSRHGKWTVEAFFPLFDSDFIFTFNLLWS